MADGWRVTAGRKRRRKECRVHCDGFGADSFVQQLLVGRGGHVFLQPSWLISTRAYHRRDIVEIAERIEAQTMIAWPSNQDNLHYITLQCIGSTKIMDPSIIIGPLAIGILRHLQNLHMPMSKAAATQSCPPNFTTDKACCRPLLPAALILLLSYRTATHCGSTNSVEQCTPDPIRRSGCCRGGGALLRRCL